MARGVTQEQVNAAIEQLLLAGERPTIERVRATLGTGSPNTLTRMLDVWWQALGQRLAAQRQSAAIPGAPAAVVDAASALWEAALAAGQAHGEALVAPERAALAAALAKVDAAAATHAATVAQLQAELQQAHAARDGTSAALAISEQRVGDLQRELAALTATAQTLGKQRENAEGRVLAAMAQRDADRAAATQEREALQRLLRQVEDRAYGEVDRTRQELKALKAELATQARDHARALRASEQQRRSAETALATARRTLARRPGAGPKARASAATSTPASGRRKKSA